MGWERRMGGGGGGGGEAYCARGEFGEREHRGIETRGMESTKCGKGVEGWG